MLFFSEEVVRICFDYFILIKYFQAKRKVKKYSDYNTMGNDQGYFV